MFLLMTMFVRFVVIMICMLSWVGIVVVLVRIVIVQMCRFQVAKPVRKDHTEYQHRCELEPIVGMELQLR